MSAKKIVRMIGIFLFFALLLGYGIWGAKYIIFGIRLEVKGITNGETITISPIEISGISKRAKRIVINGAIVPIDQNGTFKETRALVKGINNITINASDKFGKGVTKYFTVNYAPPPSVEQEPIQIEKVETETKDNTTSESPINNSNN